MSAYGYKQTFWGVVFYVRFTPYSVAKLRLRKNDAILIHRCTHLGKNESVPP